MKDFVKRFTEGNGRPVGSEGHVIAQNALVEKLKSIQREYREAPLQPYAGNDYAMPYTFNNVRYANVMARIRTASNEKPVLVGAHYDTCGFQPGADDNAAAVAILFYLIDRFLENENWKKLGRDVVFAFFDAEEAPNMMQRSMGSIQFYEQQRTDDFALAIIMDLVGHDVPVPGLEKLVAAMGMESHPSLEQLINSVDIGNNIGLVAIQNRYIGDLSDHHIFRLNNVPFLFFSCGHWQHYHQQTDTWEKLNYQKMQAIADYLHKLILAYSNFTVAESVNNYDPTQTELILMNRALGPFLSSIGMHELKSREDMDRVIQALLQFGL